VAVYPKQIETVLSTLKCTARCAHESATGVSASLECGAAVRFSVLINAESKRIEDTRFASNGCGWMIAAAETIALKSREHTLVDLRGLTDLKDAVSRALNETAPGRSHCIDIAIEAFRYALAEYRAKVLEEFQGEKALICTCFGVTEETIVEIIERDRPSDVMEISAVCNAGSGCGSCQMLIRELIDAHSAKYHSETML
jgi:NifU-like protein